MNLGHFAGLRKPADTEVRPYPDPHGSDPSGAFSVLESQVWDKPGTCCAPYGSPYVLKPTLRSGRGPLAGTRPEALSYPC
jgi:hypothetical protein